MGTKHRHGTQTYKLIKHNSHKMKINESLRIKSFTFSGNLKEKWKTIFKKNVLEIISNHGNANQFHGENIIPFQLGW